MRILSMSGFIPEQICDTVRFTGFNGERNISHFCGYANDFISQVNNDSSIDGAVFPKSCDSCRIIQSYLENSNKFIHQIVVPSRQDDMAIDFFTNQLKTYAEAIEKYFNITLNDIKDRTNLLNKRNISIAECYKNLPNISYFDYLNKIHNDLSSPLLQNEPIVSDKLAKKHNFHHKVYLVGSFLCNTKIVDIIEKNGLGIVGDNLPESGRIQGKSINIYTDDIYKEIAKDILSRKLSPTQNNFENILNKDINELKNLEANAVIFVNQKYCEPYDFLYSIYKKRLDELKIPSLLIRLSNSLDEQEVNLKVEAFSSILQEEKY